jgi:glutaredoxin 3
MAKSYLAEKGVKFTEYDVSANQDAAREMVDLSGQMGVPVISINGELVIGFNRSRIDQLISQGEGAPVSLGITVADADKILGTPGSPMSGGAYVGSVKPGSPADRLGLRTGDIIVKLAAMPVTAAADVEKLMSTLKKGDRLTAAYRRSNVESSGETVI